jgi:hypothetical protein
VAVAQVVARKAKDMQEGAVALEVSYKETPQSHQD